MRGCHRQVDDLPYLPYAIRMHAHSRPDGLARWCPSAGELIMRAMSVFVDDQPTALAEPTLDALLAAARQHLDGSGRVVVEVMIEGEALSGEALEQPEQVTTEGKEVRLYTADPRRLAVETLGQVRARLEDAGQIHEDAAEHLQQDQPKEGMQKVAQVVEIWMQTQQAVQHSATLLGFDLDSLEVEGVTMSELTNNLAEQLRGLKDMLNEGDTVALADALAYEWPETVQRWTALVQALIDRIEARPG